MDKEIERTASELAETESRLSSGGLKPEEIESLSRKHARLKAIIDTKRELDASRAELSQTQSMLTDTDPAVAELALSIRYDNGVIGQVVLDADTGFSVMRACAAADLNGLIGRSWREVSRGFSNV